MPEPRKNHINLIVPYNHSVSRCDRHSFLCDAPAILKIHLQGNHEQQRSWIEDRLLFLSSVFSIGSAATVFVLTL
jgi:hypothetical protein